ncbi:MAG: DUF1016 domain-containing protein [Alteromonadaceae bacterium]|nr:DUF1016 domain-containing protein [Alteromonadaceae bacterium]
MSNSPAPSPTLLGELRQLIDSARQRAAVAVNSELTLLYWQVGKRINTDILQEQRAGYGEHVMSRLASELTQAYGRGWSKRNLANMCLFAQAYPDFSIVQTLSAQLSWSHFVLLISQKDSLQREFYTELCCLENWSVRQLQERMQSMLYERTAISRKPEETIQHELGTLRRQGEPSPQLLLKDPYLLDFLGLNDRYLERDLEDAILRDIEQFLLELGAGFTFVARQKRIQIDNEDFYIDLLFYNRKLKRLVAIDLKLGRFKAEFKGQMELYLRWLARNELESGEQQPLGIILCAGKQQEQIELLELDKSGIHVAEYLTVLPPRETLQAKLHESIINARSRLDGNQN